MAAISQISTSNLRSGHVAVSILGVSGHTGVPYHNRVKSLSFNVSKTGLKYKQVISDYKNKGGP